MKWYEIPKFREFCLTDSMTIGFINYVEFIEREIETNDLKINPEFQRGHVWTEEQQITYIEFLLRGGKSGRDIYFNLSPKTGEYVLVDGLQRTEALRRFVHNEIKAFGQTFSEFEFNKRVAGGMPFPEYKITVHMNSLKDKREILEWYIEMNSGGTPHSKEELDRVRSMIQERID